MISVNPGCECSNPCPSSQPRLSAKCLGHLPALPRFVPPYIQNVTPNTSAVREASPGEGLHPTLYFGDHGTRHRVSLNRRSSPSPLSACTLPDLSSVW